MKNLKNLKKLEADLNQISPEQIRAEKAKRAKEHLKSFLLYDGLGTWKNSKHLQLLCEKLEAVERGEIKRLMVFMPPRHGKSEIISKKFPAWFLGRNPEKEIIISSYSADLALDFSKIARNTLREHADLFGVNIAKDSAAAGRWGLEGTRGGMMAAGVGGPLTGRGSNCAIIDDPLKNWQDAASKVMRDNVREWYKSTLRTRLAPGASIVIVMTRWHEDDLAGWLLKEAKDGNGEQWEVINFPAEAEGNDPLGREAGQWLWPERFSTYEYEQTRLALGSRLWAALYQQHPSPDQGDIFKREWFKTYRAAPATFDKIIQSWDMAFKDLSTSDFVVGQVWGQIGADKYLLDQVRGKLGFPATVQAVRSLSAKWPQATEKIVEDKANGPAVIATLKSEIAGLIATNPEGGKIVRAQAVSPEIEAGNIHIPDSSIAAWIHDFIEEFAAFPNGLNDDQVDATTQALTRLKSGFKPWAGKFDF